MSPRSPICNTSRPTQHILCSTSYYTHPRGDPVKKTAGTPKIERPVCPVINTRYQMTAYLTDFAYYYLKNLYDLSVHHPPATKEYNNLRGKLIVAEDPWPILQEYLEKALKREEQRKPANLVFQSLLSFYFETYQFHSDDRLMEILTEKYGLHFKRENEGWVAIPQTGIAVSQ